MTFSLWGHLCLGGLVIEQPIALSGDKRKGWPLEGVQCLTSGGDQVKGMLELQFSQTRGKLKSSGLCLDPPPFASWEDLTSGLPLIS